LQGPPFFSALKRGGTRLYELARKGETVEREPRPIRIDDIKLLEIAGNRLVFRAHCSKGTYIRVLVEDLAAKAGTVAHTAHLHRETVAGFEAADMLDLTGVEEAAKGDLSLLRKQLLPPDSALQSMAAVTLGEDGEDRFCSGQEVSVDPQGSTGLVRVYAAADVFMGVGELSGDGRLAPKRVFRLGEKKPIDI
jgi:tRNA pseudouridine55 synthase